LKLVHFAADSQLASDMVGTLQAGAQPTLARVPHPRMPGANRRHMAREYASGQKASSAGGGQAVSSPKASGPQAGAGSVATGSKAAGGGTGASGAAAAGGTKAAAAAGPAGVALAVGATAASAAVEKSKRLGPALSPSRRAVDEGAPPPVSPGPPPTHEER
jgi:type IV secretion system protein TrbL